MLERAQPGAFHVVPAAGLEGAQRLIRSRDAYGALVRRGSTATVLTASAGGFNAATTIQTALTKAAKPLGVVRPPRARDVVSLQRGDPAGVSLQQVVLGTILAGFLTGVLSAQLALSEPLPSSGSRGCSSRSSCCS